MANASVANNSTNISASLSICTDRDWYVEWGKSIAFVVYYIVSPGYFVMGVLCHGLSLVAFFGQMRKEKAYVYQVFITSCELVEVCVTFLYDVLFQWWSSPSRPGPVWYRSCYTCMYWSAHFSIPLQNISLTMSQLFLVFMCADRVYALWRPFGYKTVNHRRNFHVTLAVSTLLGILLNVFRCFYLNVVPSKDRGLDGQQLYDVATSSFPGTPTAIALHQLRNAAWILCLVLMYTLNAILIYFYRVKVSQAKSSKQTTTRTASERRKQDAERTLILIALFQAIFNTSSMTTFLLYGNMVMAYPTSFSYCMGAFFAPFSDAFFQIFDLLDFVAVFCVSKHFRAMIRKTFSCLRKVGASNTMTVG